MFTGLAPEARMRLLMGATANAAPLVQRDIYGTGAQPSKTHDTTGPHPDEGHKETEKEASKPIEYTHEYLLHGYEGTHRAAQLKETLQGLKTIRGNSATFMSPSALAGHFEKMGGLAKGFTGAASIGGFVVGADAVRRGDWAEAGDGFAHGAEGAILLGAGALAKRPGWKTGVRASALEWAGKAVPFLNVTGGVAHFFHNKKHAEESGSKLLWLATAGDVVSVAAGIAALLPTPIAPAALALSSAGMVTDIASTFLNGFLHKGGHHDEKGADAKTPSDSAAPH